MIKERYCSYEVSKLLKEKGFKESTQFVWYEYLPSQNAVHNSEIGKPKRDYFYWEKEGEHSSPWTNDSPIPSYISGEVYSCPTHQMAIDWLREKGFYIEIQTLFDEFEPSLLEFTNFHALITTIIDGRVIDETHLADEGIKDYGECVEFAIKYCLTELVKGGEG